MKGRLSIHLLFKGVLLYDTLAWEVRMPKEIHGLRGSCLVIPCSFYYTSYPPTDPNRVVWYQWVSRGYPLVYDPWYPNDVIDKFRGKTKLYGNPSYRSCSLVITDLDMSHHGEKLYTWIDPENVGSSTYTFYDVTSTIYVDSSPKQPTISISGGESIGSNIRVECYTFHSCPYSAPNIVLSGVAGSDQIEDVDSGNGQWKRILTRTGVVKTERSDIVCAVTHYGDSRAEARKTHSAKCVQYNITIEPKRADVIEGVAKNFVCTVFHSCQKDLPTISWNYKNMEVSTGTKKSTGLYLAAFSNITFLGAKEDHGKQLTCTAKLSEKPMTSSVNLHVQHPVKPVTGVQNTSPFHREANAMTVDLTTIGLYILLPSFSLLLVCILAGVFIYRRYQRLPPNNTQKSQPEQMINETYERSDQRACAKPRMPSPKRINHTRDAPDEKPVAKSRTQLTKSMRRPCPTVDYEDFYANMEELNMYGNL